MTPEQFIREFTRINPLKLLITSVVTVTLVACGGGGGGGGGATPSPKTVTISWDANHESAVNSAGGGYKIYYSSFPGFNLNDSNVHIIDAPYAVGPTSPIQTTVQLEPGHYYFRLVAYSSLIAPGSSSGSSSAPSAEKHYQVQ